MTGRFSGFILLIYVSSLCITNCLGKSCFTCRPNMENRCCNNLGDDFCESLIQERELRASEDTLIIPCDSGTNCLSGPVKWRTPRGDVCRFDREGSFQCAQDRSITFTGDFESGRCDILIRDFDEQRHEGRWSVEVLLATTYTDDVTIEMEGLRSSEVLGISFAVVIVLIIIVVVAIVCWRCYPNLCANKPPTQSQPTYRHPEQTDVYETLHEQQRRVSTSPQEIYVHSQDAIVNPPPTKSAKLIPRQL